MEDPSDQIIMQRIRNRLIEYLDMVITFEADPVFDFDSLINMWEDWVSRPIADGYFTNPAFTTEEVEALRSVDSAWDAFCEATPKSMAGLEPWIHLPQWRAFVESSQGAFQVFSIRGRHPEDQEI